MKKGLVVFFFVGCMLPFAFAQNPGEWTWMNGDSVQTPLAHYGTQGVFDSLNTPPALYEACDWTDLQGNFWLFGGVDYNTALMYGDLWEFKPSINQWAWIKGPNIPNQSGIYGIQGLPSPNNNPGARSWGCSTWADLNNNLWLFGGLAYDVNGTENEINDLWKYDISTNEWTWMKGSNTIHASGIYGTMGVASPLNTPPCMWENNGSWTDSNNNLWLFGGISYAHQNATLNALWKYDVSTNEWTWVNGVDTGYAPPDYGIKGLQSPTNNPGGRTVYCRWKDSNDNLWFFGGGYGDHTKNDLWKYSIGPNEWTWISGDSSLIGIAELDSICHAGRNIPAGRYENRAYWTRECDNFSLYGGYGNTAFHNDLWNYKISTNEWTMISGDTGLAVPAVYGLKGVSSPNNHPGPIGGAIAWKDSSGYLWLFGGNFNGNTMWRYVPDPSCPKLCDETNINKIENAISSIIIFPNPTTSTFTITLNNQSSFLNPEYSGLKIYDVTGRVMHEQVLASASSATIHCKLNAGIYFVKVSDGEKMLTQKLIVE